MASPRTTNIIALVAAVVIAAAGLLYLQSRPDPDECARWQTLVREQAQLLAGQDGRAEHTYYDDAALNYQESQPSGCEVPTREQPGQRL